MPGVPPNAIDNLKRAIKGMFKRGKKSKQEPQQQPVTSAQPEQPSQIDTSAPQLPPIQNASPLQSATGSDTSKPLPPTHPLATGQHDEPQEAVPQDHEAKPGPPPGTAVTSGDEVAKVEENRDGDVSPPDPSLATGEDTKNDAVSAVEEEQQMSEPPPKVDSAVEEPKTTEQTADASTMEETNKPADTAVDDKPTTNGTTTSDEQPTDRQRSGTMEEKVPVMEEPPPIKAVRAAPGMSATSGPLEDFPEGGDLRDD